MLERMFDLARLTAEQRRAATHDGGNLLIAAGAGTGKTTTVAARLAHLVSSGVAPERILLLTFSRRAAAEQSVERNAQPLHLRRVCHHDAPIDVVDESLAGLDRACVLR